MPFTDRPDNKSIPADVSEGVTLWNVVVAVAEAHQSVREGHEAIIDMMLGKLEDPEKAPALIAQRWRIIHTAQEIIADGEKILEDHRDEIATLPVKLQ
ncbi:hypothetical protein [Paraburkholderia sp. RL17-337-BIB-A]|uniref:hypothetical protein n=1 Tax=Paraburkholderia sp. RL17-337-BIB-A TaxID=3031636 RepID=UPI0038BBDE6A